VYLDRNEVPFNVPAAEKKSGWREKLAWPVRLSVVALAIEEIDRRLLANLCAVENQEERLAALLLVPYLHKRCLIFLESALNVQFEKKTRILLYGAPPEIDYFRGEVSEEELPPPAIKNFLNIGSNPSFHWLRQLKNTACRSGWRLPRNLFFPTAILIADSPMISAGLVHNKKERLRFSYAESFLAGLEERQTGDEPKADVHALSDRLTQGLANIDGLEEPYKTRLEKLLLRECVFGMSVALRDIERISNIPNLPDNLWAGTGGKYLSRLIGLEIIRRGGKVTRFDHGGIPGALSIADEHLPIYEFGVSTKFVISTRMYADFIVRSGARDKNPGICPVEIDGLEGDPSFKQVSPGRATSGQKRLKVLYVTTIYRGFYQYTAPILPDPVYMDWQLRLVEILKKLPVKFFCQPHPEGLYGGASHPLAGYASSNGGNFEEVMEEADVFLFDYFNSQVFLKALCTGKTVVLIDVANSVRLNAEVAKPFSERCRLLKPTFDETNRPFVDEEILADAILAGSDPADPSYFRRLLVGDI